MYLQASFLNYTNSCNELVRLVLQRCPPPRNFNDSTITTGFIALTQICLFNRCTNKSRAILNLSNASSATSNFVHIRIARRSSFRRRIRQRGTIHFERLLNIICGFPPNIRRSFHHMSRDSALRGKVFPQPYRYWYGIRASDGHRQI